MPSKESISKDVQGFLNFCGIIGETQNAYLRFCEDRNMDYSSYESVHQFKKYLKV